MKWEKAKLSDLCGSIADGDHQPPPKAPAGVPFVTISNISSNKFDFTNTMFVPQSYYDSLDSKRKAQRNDVLYSVVGSFGIPVFMNEDVPFVFQRHIAILRPNDRIVPRFLYYTMLSRDFYMMADAAAIGSAQRTVSLSALRNMEIFVPPIKTQRRIADILSAFDDLIENNRKQIKLLEEAAQRLYKEWFVDLRFPGWETAEIVDGVPVGWSQKQIYEVAEIKAGGDKPEIVSNRATEHTPVPIYANGIEQEGLYGYTNKAIINKESVTISARGTVGFVFLRRTPYVPIVRLLSVIPYDIPALYLYYCLKNTSFERNGTSQQQITVPMVKNKELIIAEKSIIESFAKIVNNYHDKIDSLKAQIKYLSEARDRLLPKLMSGELEV